MTKPIGRQGKTMKLREFLNRTGEGKACVVGWGRGMGHKGHMYLASSVITQANESGADPYFVLSRSVGKDDPLYPEEKINIYKKVFPKHGQIFHVATEEMPDLTRVLHKLNEMGYTDCTVVVGADQVKALSYVKQYNGIPNKQGDIPFNFNRLDVIARQETNDPSREEEGPRATPMRDILKDPNASEEHKFQAWRDAMSPELSDDEVRDLMHKAGHRMHDPAFGKKPKKEKVADESIMSLLGKSAPAVKKPSSSLSSIRNAVAADKAASDALPPPHIRMYLQRMKDAKEKGIQPQFTSSEYATLQQWIKQQQIYGTALESKSIKYANRIIREMRAKDFVKEGKTTQLHPDHEAVSKGYSRSRDIGGYDRIYHMNRLMMAMAMANGRDTKSIDGAAIDTWAEKYNTMHPMTKEEDNKIRAAMRTVPTDGKHISAFGLSQEPDGINTKSVVAKPKKNKYGI